MGLYKRVTTVYLTAVSYEEGFSYKPTRSLNLAPYGTLLSYHMYTIWLFTRSDLKTIVAPSTVFSLVSLLSGPILAANSSFLLPQIAFRFPLTVFWVWINLLPFVIDNQRQPESIKEDAANKGWRPLPSKRLTPEQATKLMRISYPLAFLSSFLLGGTLQCVLLIGLGHWYNNLNGADRNCIVRNFINACGYICFNSGAVQVASASLFGFQEPVVYQWILMIWLVVMTTIQVQDLSDQVGDSLHNRWTVPLTIGDLTARWTVALPLIFWSWFCPMFWQLRGYGYITLATFSTVIVWRMFMRRSAKADKTTFWIYNLWIANLCLAANQKFRPKMLTFGGETDHKA